MNGALEGIKVIDLSRLLPGPYCSSILANHGADVICVEDPRFGSEPRIDMLYWNKKHMVLNLKTEGGKEIFYALAGKADVVIEQFRPGTVKALGIDYTSLQKINPRLVYCSITSYGQNGPYKNMAGHDVNCLAFSGVLGLIGEKKEIPRIPGIQIADLAAGGMNAAIGILMALMERGHSGKGQYMDISMADGMVGMLTVPMDFYFKSHIAPERSNTFVSHRYACYNVYETADGKYICIGALEPKFWKNLCDCFGVPQYSFDQFDDDRKEEITSFFRQAFKKKTRDEWTAELRELDVCFAPLLSVDEVVEDKHFLEREMIVMLSGKGGKEIPVIGLPIKLSRTPGLYEREPDKFGESTRDVLKELGYSENEMNDLAQNKVI